MAFKPKDSDEVEEENLPEKSHSERLLESQTKKFIENDRKTYESILSAYEEHRKIMDEGTQDERIMHYATLHVQRGFASYLIGEGLNEEQERINGGKSQYGSIAEFFTTNASKLPFDRKTMYQYMQIAKAVTFADFKKLGVKKTLVAAQVKDDKRREQIVKVFADKKIDELAARTYVDTMIREEKEQRGKAKVVEMKKIIKAHPYSVTAKKIDGVITVKVSPEDHAGMLSYLNVKEAEIKKYLDEYEYKDETD